MTPEQFENDFRLYVSRASLTELQTMVRVLGEEFSARSLPGRRAFGELDAALSRHAEYRSALKTMGYVKP